MSNYPPTRVNLDTGTAVAFVADGSPILAQLEGYVSGKQMVMTMTALDQFAKIVHTIGGSQEQARAATFLTRVVPVPDTPSPRAMALRVTSKGVQESDRIIFGTGDALGIVTMTADERFIRAASAQGVDFACYLHAPVPLAGK